MERSTVIGLDIGQQRDPTALAIVEAVQTKTGRMTHTGHPGGDPNWGTCVHCYPETEDVFHVRDIGRLELGPKYPQVALRVAEAVSALNLRCVVPSLLVDVTGVGRPVFDIMSNALADLDVRMSAVTFTGGHNLKGNLGSPEIAMPKPLLVSRLQALLQSRRIVMPDTAQTRALADELRVYEVRVSEDAKLTAGAFKTGTHDDMATALGLACLFDPTGQQVRYLANPFDTSQRG